MANEMPKSENYQGLSRKVLQYSEHFSRLIEKIKQKTLTESDWAAMEELIDVRNYRRMGVFVGALAEFSTWQQYKQLITEYGGMTEWAGTLRRISELPGLVYLELEERNTLNGVMDVSNTVTIYEFNNAGKVHKLDVYVMPMGKR